MDFLAQNVPDIAWGVFLLIFGFISLMMFFYYPEKYRKIIFSSLVFWFFGNSLSSFLGHFNKSEYVMPVFLVTNAIFIVWVMLGISYSKKVRNEN